jgi:hypothetical protein
MPQSPHLYLPPLLPLVLGLLGQLSEPGQLMFMGQNLAHEQCLVHLSAVPWYRGDSESCGWW